MLHAWQLGVSAAHDMGTIPAAAHDSPRPIARLALIVHADDFGETVAITDGICRAIEAGVVTSTSVMANMPGTADALRRIAPLAERASFGAHINLCEGAPLSRAWHARDGAGRFEGKRALAARALAGTLSLREVEAEISAQIALLQDAGVRLSHADGHKHLHQLPVVATATANVLPRFGIERVRITRAASWATVRGASGVARELLARRAARVFARAHLRSPQGTLDVRDLMGDPMHLAHLAGRGRRAQLTLEVCCHPGTEAADRGKPGSHERSRELEFLLSPEYRDMLHASGAALVNYWRL
jgi:predicted glycoside hydrolase/deacetylase ChbG (UPF0249 family)